MGWMEAGPAAGSRFCWAVSWATPENRVQTRVIRDYIFKIYTYDQRYSNGIVDRYHWITIARAEQPAAAGKNSETLPAGTGQPLTKAELRVARLLAKGPDLSGGGG